MDIEVATFRELAHELSQRAVNICMYADLPPSGSQKESFFIHRSGDPLRLVGSIDLRLRPTLVNDHNTLWEFNNVEHWNGDE